MSKPPKIDRKTLKTPDQFVTQGRHFLEVFADFQGPILAAIVGLVVVVSGYYGYQWKQGNDLEKSWTTYAAAMKTPEARRWDELQKVFNSGGTNRATQFAAAAIADHHFSEAVKQAFKDPATVPPNAPLASEWYTKALTLSSLSQAEKGLLFMNRAGAFEMGKKLDEAMKDFETAATMGAQVKPLALLGQARIYELKNNNPKAVETYEKVSADFLNTEYSKIAKNYLRRLKSPLLRETKS